jgi:hypothetical protein
MLEESNKVPLEGEIFFIMLMRPETPSLRLRMEESYRSLQDRLKEISASGELRETKPGLR